MREYPLQAVEAMVAEGGSFSSIDGFIEGTSPRSQEDRTARGLDARSETGRENRLRRVAELMDGERHLAGRVRARV